MIRRNKSRIAKDILHPISTNPVQQNLPSKNSKLITTTNQASSPINPPYLPSKMPGRGIPPNLTYRLPTSANEGLSLGEMEGVWKELTASEMRLRMMDRLLKAKVGFNDVELFNLGLVYN